MECVTHSLYHDPKSFSVEEFYASGLQFSGMHSTRAKPDVLPGQPKVEKLPKWRRWFIRKLGI